jgi:outer membrane protein OmpA-like peptidoglycan-associated protein
MQFFKTLSVAVAVVALSACSVCKTHEAPVKRTVADCINDQRQELESGLASEISAKQVRISQIKGDALKIAVSSDYGFDTGKSDISPNAEELFTKIAKVVAKCDRTLIRVVGHTDSVGTPERNQPLSERRAATVGELIANQGVSKSRIKREGRGEREPAASNNTVEGKRENRRVEIIVSP